MRAAHLRCGSPGVACWGSLRCTSQLAAVQIRQAGKGALPGRHCMVSQSCKGTVERS